MKYGRFKPLLCAALLVCSLTACKGQFDALDDITDEMLRSGRNVCQMTFWRTTVQDEREFHTSWGNMNGYRQLFTLPSTGPGSVTLTYTVEDPGEGYRVVLLTADGTLTDLVEGENALELPRGTASVPLAAVETSGEFTLELSSDNGMTMDYAAD